MNVPSPARSERTLLHLGLGSFHRAHQAVYLHRLREAGDRLVVDRRRQHPRRHGDDRRALAAQHGAYTLETVTPAGERRYERITSIREVVPWEPTLARLVEVGAEASTAIVSFTVTEAGYYLDSERPSRSLPPRRAGRPREGGRAATVYGAVAAILGARMRRGAGAVTLLNCDNLRSNGTRFRAGLLDFLASRGETAFGNGRRSMRPARAQWSTASRHARRRMSPHG